MFESLTPRATLVLALLALVPTIVWTVTRSGLGGAIASINVVLIAASLYIAFSPIDVSNRTTRHT
ncbi:cytochrome-ba3 oxidase subunit [Halovivax cerinus]|uniref:Cytochrome-ba3 oxidase subunit n=1 Tax=Halovivax cerinus TaxID=1487865 RepID=A0ABD5NSU4_9EURY|nr:cytochrome-ba3 oxidase subunit [Halovivax cerinus]